MEEKLMKVLCDALHYTFDEDACVSTLDLKKTVANLIANGVTVQKWIPVTERKPEDGVKVLVSVSGRDESLIGWYDADWDDWVVEEGLSEKKLMPVTHWQEKPKPAKEG